MKKNNIFLHLILLSIPLSILINIRFLDFNLKDFFLAYGGILITIPFFYWFYLKFYGIPNITGVIIIQLEILLHFLYTMFLLLYSYYEKNYLSVYYFLIYLFIFYCFKLAILITIKKKFP